MKSIKTYTILLCIWHAMVSCETKSKPAPQLDQNQRNSLRLNFHDNILQLNPAKASNSSEQFVAELVFDKFIDKNLESPIFASYEIDSAKDLYIFKIKEEKVFHDSSIVNSESIRKFLKYLIKNHYDSQSVQGFFSSMQGFGIVNWYRLNRGVMDSIPSGFQIIDDKSFSIELNDIKQPLLHWFQDPIFTLFLEKEGSLLGSGEFELTELNEDISAKLSRRSKKNNQIQIIHLSFIKNEDLVYSEFLKGALDLITYHQTQEPSTTREAVLNKIIGSKYPQYQVLPSSSSLVKYLEIKSVRDTVLLQKILAHVKSTSGEPLVVANQRITGTYNTDSLNIKLLEDTVLHQIGWFSQDIISDSKYFSNSEIIEFVRTNSENTNQYEPQIVIKEINTDFIDFNNMERSTTELVRKLNLANSSMILILALSSEYIIYNNKLEGFESHGSLSEFVQNVYFKDIKSY